MLGFYTQWLASMQECGVSTKEHGVHHFYNILHHAFSKADEKLAWFLNMFDHFQMNYDNIWEKAKKPNIKIYNAMVYTTAFFLLIRTNHSSSPQSHLSKFQDDDDVWQSRERAFVGFQCNKSDLNPCKKQIYKAQKLTKGTTHSLLIEIVSDHFL